MIKKNDNKRVGRDYIKSSLYRKAKVKVLEESKINEDLYFLNSTNEKGRRKVVKFAVRLNTENKGDNMEFYVGWVEQLDLLEWLLNKVVYKEDYKTNIPTTWYVKERGGKEIRGVNKIGFYGY